MGVPHIIGLIFSMHHASCTTPEKIERIREKRFRRLLRAAVAKSPFYRNLYRGIDIETCTLSDLPTVDKQTMMANFDDFVTDRGLKKAEISEWLEDKDNIGRMYKVNFVPFRTSGTTGKNALVIYDRKAVDFVHAALISRHAHAEEMSVLETLLFMFRSLFVKRFGMTAVLVTGGPYPASTIAAYPPPFYKLFVKKNILSLFDSVPEIVARLNGSSCNELYSYPSMLGILAREQLAGRLNLKFDQPLPAVVSTSEPLTESTRRLVEAAWGMKIQDTYGSSECFMMARSCGRFERMHVMSDLCIIEIVDRQGRPVPDGQVGDRILLTNLFNHAQPFIRYEIGDVTGYSTESCGCGQPFPTLLHVEGRTDDIFYIDRPGGGYESVHPNIFIATILELSQVREYQLVQTARNEVTFFYVPVNSEDEVENRAREAIENGMRRAGLSNRMTLKIIRVESIKRDERSGKIRQIVSQVGVPADLDDI